MPPYGETGGGAAGGAPCTRNPANAGGISRPAGTFHVVPPYFTAYGDFTLQSGSYSSACNAFQAAWAWRAASTGSASSLGLNRGEWSGASQPTPTW